jgi:hypothetical protein
MHMQSTRYANQSHNHNQNQTPKPENQDTSVVREEVWNGFVEFRKKIRSRFQTTRLD